MEQVYCVMDMPLKVIQYYLSNDYTKSNIKTHFITPLAEDCLRLVACQPEEIQLAVIDGEVPLHRFCRQSLLN